MQDLFEPEEEWVEVCDASGKRSAMRHLATLLVSGKRYFVLGAVSEENGETDGFLLVREDETVDGVQEYVIAEDEREIEDVVGRLVAHSLTQIVEHVMAEADEDLCACGVKHGPGEFCFCDDAEYLQ